MNRVDDGRPADSGRAQRPRRPLVRLREKKIVQAALEALEDLKAENPVVLDLRKLTSMTDYFLVAHGTNDRQVQAMARAVEGRLAEVFEVKPHHIEGLAAARWVLMDYGDFIVHLFLREQREHYGIERIWVDAPRVEL